MNARKLLLGAVVGAGAGYTIVRSLQAWTTLNNPVRATRCDAAGYGRYRRAIVASGALRSLAGTVAFAYGPFASAFSQAVAPLPRWARAPVFFASVTVVATLFELPVEFMEDHTLERSYGLSEQTTNAWFVESLKGVAFAGGLAAILGTVAAALVRIVPAAWPFAASVGLLPLLVLANVVVPLYVLPLFNTFEPVTGTLEVRLRALASRFDVGTAEILRMDMSRQTKKANAFVAGVGGTHRIVLGDTLIDQFQPDEIEFVIAHELGHYVSKDTWRMIGVAQCIGMLLFFVASLLVEAKRHDDRVAVMRIYAVLSTGMLLLRPATNAFSRSREWAADRFALATTQDPTSGVAALRKLRDQNLAEDAQPAWYEFIFASHPSLGKRIDALEHS